MRIPNKIGRRRPVLQLARLMEIQTVEIAATIPALPRIRVARTQHDWLTPPLGAAVRIKLQSTILNVGSGLNCGCSGAEGH